MNDQVVTVAETPDGYRKSHSLLRDRKADSVVDGYFVEPHSRKMPFGDFMDWLLSRRTHPRKGPIRYVQTQNNNLMSEFQPLQEDLSKLTWAAEYFGIFSRLFELIYLDGMLDASNVWIGNEESVTSLHLGNYPTITSLTSDHYENLYCQVLGSKTFYLIPPTEYPCLKGLQLF
jgi:peptidyl-lysine (3S)-dioxygenase / protease